MKTIATTPTTRKVEVWAKDQYRRHEIIFNNFPNVEAAIDAARKYVHDKNRNNPLTFDEQKRNWSFCLCELGEGDEHVYAGALIHAKNKMLVKKAVGNSDSLGEEILDGIKHNQSLLNGSTALADNVAKVQTPVYEEQLLDASIPQRFYLGKLPNNKPWYAESLRRQPITSLEDPILSDKTILFIHKQ